MNKDNCIFCKIAQNEIPSATIYENDEFKVILDRAPANEGHCLVISKQHIENIFDKHYKQYGNAFELASKIAFILKDKLNCGGINILQNNGEVAGQSVNHFHIHIIPRHKNDNIDILGEKQSCDNNQIENMKKILVSNLNI